MTLLSGAYRLFFPAAGLMATLAIPLWVLSFEGNGVQNFEVTKNWHVHEMLFGYLGAALAGFLLTALPNWTGRPTLSGLPLLVLFLLWLTGRVVMLAAPDLAPLTLAFSVALATITSHEIIRGGNTRNLVVAGILWLFALAHGLMIWGDPLVAQRLGFGLAACLLTLIGGRITPAFTRNWLKAQGKPTVIPEFGRIDKIAIASTVLAMLSWVALDMHPVTGLLAAAATVAQALRLARWKAPSVRAEPLLLALHAGYGWLVIALALLAARAFGVEAVGASVAHAFGAGAVGSMTLIVMTRALLGHSKRKITANWLDILALLSVHVGAVLRLIAEGNGSQEILMLSGVLWSVGFAAFVLRAVPLALTRTA